MFRFEGKNLGKESRGGGEWSAFLRPMKKDTGMTSVLGWLRRESAKAMQGAKRKKGERERKESANTDPN